MKKVYPIKEFTVCYKVDSEALKVNCTIYNAIMFNDFTFEVNKKHYNNIDFNKIYSINIP